MSVFANVGADGTYSLTIWGYTALIIALIAILLLGNLLFGKKRAFSAREISFAAMAIALGTVASMIKLFNMPMGGSVTLLSMLFIVLVGNWYGLGMGLSAALAYGILQMLLGPYIISLPQMICDYILAFGALGLSGLFARSKKGLIKGYILAVLGRYFFAVLSGVIFFGAYAEGVTFAGHDFTGQPLLYSLAYNGLYLFAESVITLLVIAIPPVRKGLIRIREMALGEA